MTETSNCPGCDGPITTLQDAVVSPFLATRIWEKDPFPIKLAQCSGCGLRFFNPRLDPEEESRLYSGYREESYLKTRNSVEPWYTRNFNASITDQAFIRKRKEKVSELLRQHLTVASPKILDFGGAHGELVADLIPGARAYVYDVSGVEPLPGVAGCGDLMACREQNFDLILSSNVLEHLGKPKVVMDEMRSIAGPSTMLWVEVPHESPSGFSLQLRRLAQHLVLAVLRPQVAISLARPGCFCHMHEHVNFFELETLEKLLKASGWHVKASGLYDLTGPLGQQEWVWAMGQAV